MSTVSVWSCLISLRHRFQSDYEAAVRKWEGDLSADNVTALLESVVESSRPLVGVRTKSNVNWYHDYPILVVYTEVDWSSKSKWVWSLLITRNN